MNRRRVLFRVGLLLTSVLCGVLARFAAGLAEVEWARLLTVAALLLAAFSVALVVRRFLRGNKPGLPRERRALQLTARGIVFLLVVLLLGVSTIDSGNNLLILVLSTLVAALLVSGFGSNLGLQNLHVSLQLPSRIHAGQKAVFLLTLRNLKRWVPSFGIRLRNRRCEEVGEEATDFFGQEQHFPYLAAGGSLELQMETIFGERGAYSLEGFEVTTSFPFGFLVRRRHLEARGMIVVYPRLLETENLLRRHPLLRGTTARFRPGQGREVYTIRDYRSGDRSQSVHWKATARTGRLMVKEFLAEEAPPHRLYLFREIRSCEDGTGFESAVSAVATIVRHLWKCRQRAQVSSTEFSCEVGDQKDYLEVMRYLALVRPLAGADPVLPRNVQPGQVFFSAACPWGETHTDRTWVGLA